VRASQRPEVSLSFWALGVAISNADWRERVGEEGGETSWSSVAVSISSPVGGG